MSTTREVRADQHGTRTGYAYGCRCDECRSAQREYRKAPHVAAETAVGVIAALEREADLDGLATATQERLGELAGVSREHAGDAIRVLAAAGRLRVLGEVGRGGVLEIQLEGFE